MPVGANNLQVDTFKKDDLPGFTLHNQFKDAMIHAENNRLDQSNPDAAEKYNYFSIGVATWNLRGFDDVGFTHLERNSKELLNCNNKNILKVYNLIMIII